MPIYKANGEFVERVYKGKEPILRIYKPNKDRKIKEENFVVDEIEEDILLDDNSSLLYSVVKGTDRELVYGLFNIDYNKGLQDQQLIGDVEDKYAWGKKRTLPTLPSDPTEYAYLTHWFNWYDDYALEQLRKNGISKDDQKDLSLFAKWKQKKFSYKGSWKYSKQEWVPGSSWDVPTSGAAITDYYPETTRAATTSVYPPTYSYYCGCTSWVVCRIYDITGDKLYPQYSKFSGEDPNGPQPGDVVVYYNSSGQGVHQGFIESDGRESFTNAAGYGYESNKVHFGSIGSSLYSYRKYYKTAASDMGGHWETVTETGSKSGDCVDQKNPSMPTAPKGEWTSTTCITQERQLVYDSTGTSDWGSWNTTKESSDSWDKDWTGD